MCPASYRFDDMCKPFIHIRQVSVKDLVCITFKIFNERHPVNFENNSYPLIKNVILNYATFTWKSYTFTSIIQNENYYEHMHEPVRYIYIYIYIYNSYPEYKGNLKVMLHLPLCTRHILINKIFNEK